MSGLITDRPIMVIERGSHTGLSCESFTSRADAVKGMINRGSLGDGCHSSQAHLEAVVAIREFAAKVEGEIRDRLAAEASAWASAEAVSYNATHKTVHDCGGPLAGPGDDPVADADPPTPQPSGAWSRSDFARQYARLERDFRQAEEGRVANAALYERAMKDRDAARDALEAQRKAGE